MSGRLSIARLDAKGIHEILWLVAGFIVIHGVEAMLQ